MCILWLMDGRGEAEPLQCCDEPVRHWFECLMASASPAGPVRNPGESHDPQDALVHARSDAITSRSPVCHGGSRHAPPHAGVSRPVPEGSGATEGFCGHAE